jgi:hypothetical protein
MKAQRSERDLLTKLSAVCFFALALVLAFKALTIEPHYSAGEPAQDRIMTDEVAAVKRGTAQWGDPTPRGGLPELRELITAGDYEAAAETAAGLRGRFAPIRAELDRRADYRAKAAHAAHDHSAHGNDHGHQARSQGQGAPTSAAIFDENLAVLSAALESGDEPTALAVSGKSFKLWSAVEADLSRTHLETSTLLNRGALFLAAWLSLTLVLTFVTDKGKAAGAAASAGKTAPERGLNLMAWGPVRALMASRAFPAAFQAFALVVFLIALVAGFTGPANTTENLASVLIWSLWWSPLMIGSLLLLGKVWCGICPLGAISAIAERFGNGRRSPDFNKKLTWGVALTPLAISAIGFVLMRMPLYGVSYAVTQLPMRTSLYFGVWTAMAIGVSLLWARRAWCRYWCPVSTATSVIAKLAPINFVHAQEAGVANCSTLEYPGRYLSSDRRCVYCLKCTQAYPNEPVYARLTLPGASLIKERHLFGEAVISLILLAVFPIGHGLGRLGFFADNPMLAEYRAGYFTAIAGTLALYALVSRVSAWLSKHSFHDTFARFGGAYLPMGVLFSLGMAVSGIMRGAGNWLNVTLPMFGVHGYRAPALASPETISAWQHWSMAWMTPIGGLWGLALVFGLAKSVKVPVKGWLPHALLIAFFVAAAWFLPMPAH